MRIGEDTRLSCSALLQPVEYLCEIEMTDERAGYIDCVGTELIEVEANCDVQMSYNDSGDVIC